MVKTGIQMALTASDPVMRLVHRAPVMVHLDTTLRDCARVMTEESIGAVLVKASHGPAGVLSERDIIAAVADGARLDDYRARDFMTLEVDTVDGGTTIRYAVQEMLGNEIRHLAVSDDGRTVGLISIRDLLAVFGGVLSRPTSPPGGCDETTPLRPGETRMSLESAAMARLVDLLGW